MRLVNSVKILLSTGCLAIVLACSGSTRAPGPGLGGKSSGLDYVDPIDATSWRLVKDASSTDTHLVLNLVGPGNTRFRGVGFNLKSDGTVPFSHLGDDGYVQSAGVFNLKSTFENYPVEPVLLAGGVKQNGTILSVGIYQKDRYQPAVAVDKPVLRIAFDFSPTATAPLMAGTVVPLTVIKTKAIPASIGTPADPNGDWSMAAALYASSLVPVDIAVGTLKTK